MSDVRPLAPVVMEQIFELLRDEAIPVPPFSVHYQGFAIAADQLLSLSRTNAATYQLRRSGAEAGQWAERAAIQVLFRRVGTKLEQAFQYPHGWRDVVYDLGSAWQTDTEALIGFRMQNGSAGRNRWFGRRDGNVETRTTNQMQQLTGRVRQELALQFAAQNQAADTGLPAQWLTVARLPLASPTALAATPDAKTALLRQLSLALVVGEVLRDESFGADPPAPAYFLLGAMHQDKDDQTARFLASGRWENDDPTRYADLAAQVKPGDRVALKSSYARGTVSTLRVKARGTVQAMEAAGQVLRVAWDAPMPATDFPGLGGYRQTIHRLNRPDDIATIFQLSAQQSAPMPSHPLNQILYGPPGTGKTYSTTAWALALLNPNNLSVDEVEAHYGGNYDTMRQAFKQYREQGQIGFVSFHQSFAYEDFVEGIKPALADEDDDEASASLAYGIEAGIFKVMAERAVYGLELMRKANLAEHGAPVPMQALSYNTLFDLFSSQLQEQLATAPKGSIRFDTKNKNQVVLGSVSSKGNLIFYHANGSTESTFPITKKRFSKLYHAFPTVQSITNMDRDISGAIGGANTSVFWAFFRAFKVFEEQQNQLSADAPPVSPNINDQLRAVVERSEMAARTASKYDFFHLTPEDLAAAPRFVLIIDEINRGNVASIFGELISLLEDDKRGGRPHELRVTLPYSKESFTVPPNLYVLGTMNTADRSVEALDTALRRRFSFHELAPQPHLLRADVGGISLPTLLTALNERLETLLDRDHRLGHAWLLEVTTLDQLRTVFQHKIIPQLQEYFYGHWERIGQVLGKAFVRRNPLAVKLMPGFGDHDAGGDEPMARYEITPAADWSVADFQGLYQGLN